MNKEEKKIALISQGCRLNHAETAGLIQAFSQEGVSEVQLNEAPDIVVINTCTVTENGDKDTLKLIKKITQANNNSKIALIGCQSQIKKEKLLELKNVEWVIGNEKKKDAADIILKKPPGLYMNKIEKKEFFHDYSSFDPRHTRVNLKIQDGCDFYCSFCIIPFARGPARSRNFNNIIDDATALIRLGVKELVLTGINLGTYQNSGYTFIDILEALLKINKKTRIRISSIEPTTIDEQLINLWKKHSNFCRYLHIPIQSGTDEILEKMRRKYTLNEYNTYIEAVKKEIPDICIGTDVIVGFPGETDALFNKTKAYLDASPINYFHVFSYSERTMAHSRKFNDPVDPSIIKLRSKALRDLHDQKWASFLEQHKGKELPVLFEQKKGGEWVGSTEHFIKVRVKAKGNLKNKIHSVKLIERKSNEMNGTIS